MPSRVLVCLPHIFSRTMALQHQTVVPGAPLRRKINHVYVKIVRSKCTQNLTVIIVVDYEILLMDFPISIYRVSNLTWAITS